MLCSMCQNGTTKTWLCVCGQDHCMHVWNCSGRDGCGLSRYEGREDTRLTHRLMESGVENFGAVNVWVPSNDPRDMGIWQKRFHTQRQMFFFPDTGKDLALVLAPAKLNQGHADWWAQHWEGTCPHIEHVIRGFIFDYMLYFYIGPIFDKINPEQLCNCACELGRVLHLPDYVPVFNGMHVGDPGTPWVPQQHHVTMRESNGEYHVEPPSYLEGDS